MGFGKWNTLRGLHAQIYSGAAKDKQLWSAKYNL